MEIVYDESTGTWSEREEPYTTLEVQTEEDWNKLEFMINNFSRLEEENKELKRLLRLAVQDFEKCVYSNNCPVDSCGTECPFCYVVHECLGKWKHAEEAERALEESEKNG